jgi:ribosomal protein L28
MSKSKSTQATQSNKLEAYDFKQAMMAHTSDQMQAFELALNAAIDDRVRFEMTRKASTSGNEPIVGKLNKFRKSISHDAMRAMLELGVDPNFINHTLSKDGAGQRFNIYAAMKAIKIVEAIIGVDKMAQVTFATLKSMINFKDAGEKFTGELAGAAVSDKIRLQTSAVKLLHRHTVSKATVSTQKSSDFRVLQALNLVVNKGAARSPVYEFANTNQAQAVQSLLRSA